MVLIHLVLLFWMTCAGVVRGSYRYYGTYLPYGTGDTMVYVLHMYGGPSQRHARWIVECQDGEAMTGIQDFIHDFERLEAMKCQFMFPQKPPANGAYPYFPSCHVRNFTNQFFCLDPTNHDRTVNTFVTAMWDTVDFLWQVWRPGADDQQLYKCCKTPNGYYIDYVSCYYVPTHDPYFEYYDSPSNIIVQCGSGYIATGISKKLNPWTTLYNVDWIQCCRLGFGPNIEAHSPPVADHGPDRTPVYYARQAIERADVPEAYRKQYHRESENKEQTLAVFNLTMSSPANNDVDEIHVWSSRYAKAKPRPDDVDLDELSHQPVPVASSSWPTSGTLVP